MTTRYKYETRFKEGQEVILWPDSLYNLPKLLKVQRVTGSFVIAGGQKYTLRGREWGTQGDWHYDRIEVATPESRARMQSWITENQDKARRGKALSIIENTTAVRRLSTERLERIAALIQEPEE